MVDSERFYTDRRALIAVSYLGVQEGGELLHEYKMSSLRRNHKKPKESHVSGTWTWSAVLTAAVT